MEAARVPAEKSKGISAVNRGSNAKQGSKTKSMQRHKGKEESLSDFLPKSYSAFLEGSLLTNGDLKGSWRVSPEDKVKNEFCMVLMDKGVYDGGFNLRIPQSNSPKPFVKEVHDKWNSFEWCETAEGSFNIWGRGHNSHFGDCCLIGVHEPLKLKIKMYKVGEEEMLRAQAFARALKTKNPFPAERSTGPFFREIISVGQKRRLSTSGDTKDTAAAAAVPAQAAGDRLRAVQSRSSGTKEGSGENGNGPDQEKITGGKTPTARNGSSSTPYLHQIAKGSRTPITFTRSLPGFSGCFRDSHDHTGHSGHRIGSSNDSGKSSDDCSRNYDYRRRKVDDRSRNYDNRNRNLDDLSKLATLLPRTVEKKATDLTAASTRLQKEKLKIQQDANAKRKHFILQQVECNRNILKRKAEEAMLLRAVQEVRQKMAEDERQSRAAAQHIKSFDMEEQLALKLWNEKWAVQVAPFIAQCEQEVKKKSEELEKKAIETEKQRIELEKELQHLRTVKSIAAIDGEDAPV